MTALLADLRGLAQARTLVAERLRALDAEHAAADVREAHAQADDAHAEAERAIDAMVTLLGDVLADGGPVVQGAQATIAAVQRAQTTAARAASLNRADSVPLDVRYQTLPRRAPLLWQLLDAIAAYRRPTPATTRERAA